MVNLLALVSPLLLVSICSAFSPSFVTPSRSTFHRQQYGTNQNQKECFTVLFASKVGIFFGTSTGSTEGVADLIANELGSDVCDGPFEIDGIAGSVAEEFQKYDKLIVGTPTWNTGADTERSGTGWDDIYYGEMQDLDVSGKKVAVFGLGDQISYAENYADASGELHNIFESLGCKMMGYTSIDGYEHEASKAVRNMDDGTSKFCALLCDAVNQEDLTEERVQNWIVQLKKEDFFDDGGTNAMAAIEESSSKSSDSSVSTESHVETPQPAAAVSSTHVNNVAPVLVKASEEDAKVAILKLQEENAKLRSLLEANSLLMEDVLQTQDDRGYTPHYNAKTKQTMWTSPDGRTCYYTKEAPKNP